jgi:hypothetical protein
MLIMTYKSIFSFLLIGVSGVSGAYFVVFLFSLDKLTTDQSPTLFISSFNLNSHFKAITLLLEK